MGPTVLYKGELRRMKSQFYCLLWSKSEPVVNQSKASVATVSQVVETYVGKRGTYCKKDAVFNYKGKPSKCL